MSIRAVDLRTRPPIVAIDGPAGSGKSTVARKVAERLMLPYLDTGAMYRAVTLQVLRNGADPSNEAEVSQLANQIEIRFAEGNRTLMNGEDVSDKIRELDVTRNVSAVSSLPTVRERMVALQQAAAQAGGVLEGRDIGTVVFPDAALKVFLFASDRVRAERRLADLQRMGISSTIDEVLLDIQRRDKLDSEREHSPLRRARDAKSLDTTGLTIDEVIDTIVKWAIEKGLDQHQWVSV